LFDVNKPGLAGLIEDPGNGAGCFGKCFLLILEQVEGASGFTANTKAGNNISRNGHLSLLGALPAPIILSLGSRLGTNMRIGGAEGGWRWRKTGS
jgi:hypothetical protein